MKRRQNPLLRGVLLVVICATEYVGCVVYTKRQVFPGSEFQAVYKLTNPEMQIRAYIYDVVRASVPMIKLDDVFSVREHTPQALFVYI